jgi:hypothetical protein
MTLDENDFLTFHLYQASHTPRIKKARRRNWILITVIFLILSSIFFIRDDNALGYYFLILSIITAIFHPFYSKWKYKRLYQKHIHDTFKNNFGKRNELEFGDSFISITSNTGVTKINKSEITEVNEIQDYYFLKVSSGVTLMIAKQKVDDIEQVKIELKSLIEKNGIKHNIELDWKWR